MERRLKAQAFIVEGSASGWEIVGSIAAGSLLEFALQEIPSFGVGRIRSLYLYSWESLVGSALAPIARQHRLPQLFAPVSFESDPVKISKILAGEHRWAAVNDIQARV